MSKQYLVPKEAFLNSDCDEDGDPCDGKIPELKVQKKNKKTILIKGFLLSKTNNYSESGIKISDLDKNTIGISIQFKNRNKIKQIVSFYYYYYY